jgi:hypothetical protein
MLYDWVTLPSLLWGMEAIYYKILFEDFLVSVLNGCTRLRHEAELAELDEKKGVDFENTFNLLDETKKTANNAIESVKKYKIISITLMLLLPCLVAVGIAINSVLIFFNIHPFNYDVFSTFPILTPIVLFIFRTKIFFLEVN